MKNEISELKYENNEVIVLQNLAQMFIIDKECQRVDVYDLSDNRLIGLLVEIIMETEEGGRFLDDNFEHFITRHIDEELRKPIKMSFYRGTLDRKRLAEYAKITSKDIRYTYGFSYRNPTTNKKLISKEEALEIIEKEGFLDADEDCETLFLNAYSANDMF